MDRTSKLRATIGVVGALASIAGLGATLANIVAPTVGWTILAGGIATLGWPLSSRLFDWLRRVRASRILMVTPKVGELDIWRSSHDRDGVAGSDHIRVVYSKPQFAFLVVKNKGPKHLDNVIKDVIVADSEELRLGQWVEEYTGEFLPHDPDGITLKVGAKRLLLLGVTFPNERAKEWFRVESGIPKKYYIGYDSVVFRDNRKFEENPATIEVRLQEEGLDYRTTIKISFDREGVPCLIEIK